MIDSRFVLAAGTVLRNHPGLEGGHVRPVGETELHVVKTELFLPVILVEGKFGIVGRCAQIVQVLGDQNPGPFVGGRFLRRRFRGRLFVVQDLLSWRSRASRTAWGVLPQGAPGNSRSAASEESPCRRSRARRPRPKSEPMPVISVFSCSSLHTQSSSQNPAPFPCRLLLRPNFCKRTGELTVRYACFLCNPCSPTL